MGVALDVDSSYFFCLIEFLIELFRMCFDANIPNSAHQQRFLGVDTPNDAQVHTPHSPLDFSRPRSRGKLSTSPSKSSKHDQTSSGIISQTSPGSTAFDKIPKMPPFCSWSLHQRCSFLEPPHQACIASSARCQTFWWCQERPVLFCSLCLRQV